MSPSVVGCSLRMWRIRHVFVGLLVPFMVTACIPLEGKQTHETLGPDNTYLSSKIWNADGVYTDKWYGHTIAELPPGLGIRICDYQAMRIWMAMDHVTYPVIPLAEYSAKHLGCSFAAYLDMPDRIKSEGDLISTTSTIGTASSFRA